MVDDGEPQVRKSWQGLGQGHRSILEFPRFRGHPELHLRFGFGLYRACQQGPVAGEKWLQQEYPRIRAMATKMKADIYFEDEAGIRSDSHAGTTWGSKGQTPVVSTTGARFGCSFCRPIPLN